MESPYALKEVRGTFCSVVLISTLIKFQSEPWLKLYFKGFIKTNAVAKSCNTETF